MTQVSQLHECERVDCHRIAEFYPILLLRPKGYTGPPARITIRLGLCEECAKTKNPDEFITEVMWKMLIGAFATLKRQKPHRSSAEVEFVLISSDVWKQSLFVFAPAKPD